MALHFLGPAPNTSEFPSSSKLRTYRLKAGRIPSRNVPLLPKFGFSPQKPTQLQVSPDEKTVSPTTPNPPKQNLRFITIPPATLSSPQTTIHTRPHTRALMPIVTTGAFWLPAPHICDPCTIHCLDHILSCGHKVLTSRPEPCALNCHSRFPPDLLQPRDVGSPFACTACIVEHLAQRRGERRRMYRRELVEAASAPAPAPADGERERERDRDEGWVREKLGFVELVWRDEDVDEFRTLYAGKRASMAPWVEPEFQEMVNLATSEAAGAARRRRTSGASLMESSRPVSPTPTMSSAASRTTSVLSSWRRSG